MTVKYMYMKMKIISLSIECLILDVDGPVTHQEVQTNRIQRVGAVR